MSEEPVYVGGETPMVGDLVEFGTRHKRLLVTSIDDESHVYSMQCGSLQFKRFSVALMKLIARHGQPHE